MLRWLRQWFGRCEPKRDRLDGEKCENCIYFADHRDLPDNNLGYCTRPYVLQQQWNEYGGFWTDGNAYCGGYEG